jgi:hypothetical protein
VIVGTAAVDIVRTAGLVMAEEKVLRKVLENARMIASKATTAVKVFVVKKELAVAVGSLGVSVMRK